MNESKLIWHSPWALWLIPLAIAAIVFCYIIGNRKRSSILGNLLHPNLIPLFTAQVSPLLRRLKGTLILLSAVFIVLSLARPQWGYYWEERPQKTVDVLFAIDTSKSMLTPDISPNRLVRAKLAIEELVNNLDGVRVGLVPFAGDALLWCPLTYDREAFLSTLKGLDTSIIPTPGTNIASALDTSRKAFASEKESSRILVILSDGEDLGGQTPYILPSIIKSGWTVHTVGIGTPQGELIPVERPDGSSFFVTDPSGNVVKSKLDEASLRDIAVKTGGAYYPLGALGEGLRSLFDNHIINQVKERDESRLMKIHVDRYYWFACIAGLLMIAEIFLTDRRRAPASGKDIRASSRSALRSMAILVLPVLLTGFPSDLNASIPRDAQSAFEKKEYKSASKLYGEASKANPDRIDHTYNKGVASLFGNDVDGAIGAFRKAIDSGDVEVQRSAYYNLGNSLVHKGFNLLEENPQKALEEWEGAVSNFESALSLDPANEPAAHNLDLVRRLIEKLREILKQQQQQQQQSQDGQDQQDQQQEGEDGSEGQSGKDQQPQDQESDSPESKENEDQQKEQKQESGEDQQDQESQEEKNEPSDQQQQQEQKPEPNEQEQPKPDSGEQKDLKQDAKENPPPPEQKPNQPVPEATDEESLQEALLLLESLKGEDGDFADYHFRTLPPEANLSDQRDW
ncbi:MAG: VWA domain-containing protein [Opitutales bacterium]|nr:VWA domain-containing protein [Opitutales bacterium]